MPSLRDLVNNLPNFNYYGGPGTFQIERPYGNDRPFGGSSNQPYITRNIGQKWADFTDDGLFRFGAVTAVSRTAADVRRITKFFADPTVGPQFLVKQTLLQLQNVQLEPRRLAPTVDQVGFVGLGAVSLANDIRSFSHIGPTRIYNLGVNTLAQVAGSAFGSHFVRHGLLPVIREQDKYEKVVRDNNNNNQNRLVLLSNTFSNKRNEDNPVLRRYIGGPNSFLGLGETVIRKSTEFLSGRPVNSMKSGSFGVYNEKKSYGSIENVKLVQTKDDSNRLIRYFNSSSNVEVQPFFDYSFFNLGATKENFGKSKKFNGDYVNSIVTQNVNGFIPIPLNLLDTGSLGENKDFRKVKQGLVETFNILPSTNYEKWNMEDRIGVSRARTFYERTQNTEYYNDVPDASDKVNKIGLFYANDLVLEKDFTKIDSLGNQITNSQIRDIIKFRFKSIDNDNPQKGIYMVFRAYLTDFSDQMAAKWNPYTYAGRGENFYLYESFTNTITFGFMLAASSRSEMKPMYQKLNYLKSTLSPDYRDNKMRGNLMQVTIGDYVKYQPGIITDLKIVVEDDYNWEIAIDSIEKEADIEQHELPQILKCSATFIPIYNFLPTKSASSPFIGIDDSFRRASTQRNNNWLVDDDKLKSDNLPK